MTQNQMPKLTQHPSTAPWWWLTFFLLLLLATGCAAGPKAPLPREPAAGAKNIIFITSNGWHSSIVIAAAELPPDRIPETTDFPGARYLEFGWGDAEYYPAKRATIAMTLRAALTPTPAVVHVAGLRVEPARFFSGSEVIVVQASGSNFRRLIDFIDSSFERAGASRASASGPGLYATSRFYPATGKFHLNNTCNTWTARALDAAGFAIHIQGTSSAEDLMRQVRSLARAR